MSVIVFDNLPHTHALQWAGVNQAELNSKLGPLVRARTLRADKQLRHLQYAPDFFKFVESRYDVAIFYAADPQQGGSSPLSVWQAAGFWIGSRSKFAQNPSRTDSQMDAAFFAENERPSNFDDYYVVHDIKSLSRGKSKINLSQLRLSDHSGWAETVSRLVYRHFFSSTADVEINPKRKTLERLARHLEVDVSELTLSGYRQSRRTCKVRPAAIELITSLTGYSALISILSDIKGYIELIDVCATHQGVKHEPDSHLFPISEILPPEVLAALFSSIRLINESIEEFATTAMKRPGEVLAYLISKSARASNERRRRDIAATFNSLVAGKSTESWMKIELLVDAIRIGCELGTKRIREKMCSVDLRPNDLQPDLCVAVNAAVKHSIAKFELVL